jgi:hypothetical protein
VVKYVRDQTGRFFERPHYEAKELDLLCEREVSQFYSDQQKDLQFPIPTDDLTVLLERGVSDFDGFADLSQYGDGVQGVTEFLPGRKPRVKIAGKLAEDERRENRYRTTLTHEYGHVQLHAYLFEMERPRRDLAGVGTGKDRVQVCKRETMISAPRSDWMEWQAGHVCGAILMPVSHVKSLVGAYQKDRGIFGPVAPESEHGRAMIAGTVKKFQVSQDAAKVRLARLGFLGTSLGAFPLPGLDRHFA